MTKEKMKSRRWWIVVWAILYVSVISGYCIFTGYDGAWVTPVTSIVAGIIVSYVTVSSMKKKQEWV